MSDSKMIEIEVKLAYQENLLEELNNVVIKQQEQIAELQFAYQKIVQKVKSLNENSTILDNELPPHY